MKIVRLAMSPALATLLFCGCVMPPEDELAGEHEADPASTSSSGEPPAFEDGSPAARDGRTAAEVEARHLAGLGLTPVALTSWYSGSIAPGGTQHWLWNNAGLDIVYQVGLSPVGASTTIPCQVEVTRTWDVQNHSGEREFHFEIKNIGSLTCGATILLDGTKSYYSFNFGGLEPGESRTQGMFHSSDTYSTVNFAGASPSGATSSNPCQMEVTRNWYSEDGENRFFTFTVKNVGAIACQASVLVARAPYATTSFVSSPFVPGESRSWRWNNANPLDRIYVPGTVPVGATATTPCKLEVTRSYYRQVIGSDGAAEREFYYTIKNISSINCTAVVLINHVE